MVGVGEIVGLYATENEEDFVTSPKEELQFDFEGIVGEARQKRRGLEIPADVRTRGVKKGRLMRHRQQVSILGLAEVTQMLGELEDEHRLQDEQEPETLVDTFARAFGANILLDVPAVSRIPNGSRVAVINEKGWVEDRAPILEVSRYNPPCNHPGEAFGRLLGFSEQKTKKLGGDLLKIANTLRGVVASVESPSNILVPASDSEDVIELDHGALRVGERLTAYTLQQAVDDISSPKSIE